MNKAELVKKSAQLSKLSQAQVEAALDAIVDVIEKTVSKGDEVKLVGFGTFSRTKRKERVGRNPQNGNSVKIPATKVPKFRPGKDFRDRVSQ